MLIHLFPKKPSFPSFLSSPRSPRLALIYVVVQKRVVRPNLNPFFSILINLFLETDAAGVGCVGSRRVVEDDVASLVSRRVFEVRNFTRLFDFLGVIHDAGQAVLPGRDDFLCGRRWSRWAFR